MTGLDDELLINGRTVVTAAPGECPRCHAMHLIWVNEGGRTICASCAMRPERQEAHAG